MRLIQRIVLLPTAVLPVLFLAAFSAAAAQDEQVNALASEFDAFVHPFLVRQCLDCHQGSTPEAGLDLSPYQSVEDVNRAHAVWEIILRRLEAGEMPPPDADSRPSAEHRQQVVDWTRRLREVEARRHAGDPGLVPVRRLSNAEYNYTIRDLTGVDIRPAASFPVDPANAAGFDNSAESLTMSPALFEKYLGAARMVVDHLVLSPTGIAFAPHPVVTDTDRDKYCVRRIVDFYQRQPTDIADYLMAAWHHRSQPASSPHHNSLDDSALQHRVSAAYLRLVWQTLHDPDHAAGPIAALQEMWQTLPTDADQTGEAQRRCVAMRDWIVELRGKLRPRYESLYVEGNHRGSQPFVLWKNRQYVASRRSFRRDALIPQSEAAASEAGTAPDPMLIVPDDPGDRARFEAAVARFCDVFPDAFFIAERGRDYVDESSKQDGERGRLLSAGFHSMMGYFRDDGPLYDLILDDKGRREIDALWQELDFVTSAPMRQYEGFLWFDRTDSRFLRDPEFDFARPEDLAALTKDNIRKLGTLYLQKAERNGGGPVELEAIAEYFRQINAQIRRVEETRVASEPVHLTAVTEFAARAFRRPLSDAESQELRQFYQALRSEQELTHEQAIQDLIVFILMSPHFSHRMDLITHGAERVPLADNELASRLSYFLWSSMPDDELRRVAADATLHQPEILMQQVRRMLQDDRVRGLATEFAGQWLDFRRFEEHNAVDRARFPTFTDDLRHAMFEEPVRYFMDVVQQDRPVSEFLFGHHTFVNDVLAEHYGIPFPSDAGDDWIRVDNASMYGRGGALPMSVFLAMNAPGLRTSPVKRGYWVVRRLLGERIPPPPPNVPDLPQDEGQLGDLTLVEALARHRNHAECSGCHDRFDAIGIAFEGFGPTGERRTRDLGDRPVVTHAEFPGGFSGNGLDGLKTYLRSHREHEFTETLCRRLLAWGLGRSLVLSDELLIREMQFRLKQEGGRFQSLIEVIVSSPQFLNKRGADSDGQAAG